MNKKGFTLIELLAVIVILAIIALIATPIVLNIIDDAKKESDLRSAEFYLKSLELSIAQAVLDDNNITDGVYNILETGNLCTEYNADDTCKTELPVEVKGEVPKKGAVEITNGQITDVSLSVNNNAIGQNNAGEISYIEKITDICELKESLATDKITVGDKYECSVKAGTKKIFYVLEIKTDEITLILNGNYDETAQKWCASGNDNSCNANGLKDKFDEISDVWTKLTRTQIGLPTAAQVATVAGKVYTDYPNLKKTWLYQWEGNDSYNNGDNIGGYWTSTGDSSGAWVVYYDGNMSSTGVNNTFSVRPVINLKK